MHRNDPNVDRRVDVDDMTLRNVSMLGKAAVEGVTYILLFQILSSQ